MRKEMDSKFHAFMFPWFAFGHLIPYMHLANKLAQKGHKITFLLPRKAQKQLEHLNLFSDKIVFHLIIIPPVDGLPVGAETASDIPISSGKFLSQAMDLTRDQVESAVVALKPDLILFDFVYWIPEMAKEFRVKSVSYHIVSAAGIAMGLAPAAELNAPPPPGYPLSEFVLSGHDARTYLLFTGSYQRLFDRVTTGLMNCDVISIRTCKEVEGKFCDFIESHCHKKVLLTGPMFPELDNSKPLEDRWNQWLSGFEPGSVVFCALGSQVVLEEDQFRELCLGMELTGLPFLVVVKPPRGVSTIQEALPKRFEERVKGRGVVWGGWVQQPLILSHPSIGCFVNHCGSGSMWESLMSDCQIVFIPHLGDQILTTRLLTEELKVSVKVQREVETGWFSKESLRDAVMSVMDKDCELGNLVRKNHIELTETLVSPGLLSGYVDKFVEALQNLVFNTNLD